MSQALMDLLKMRWELKGESVEAAEALAASWLKGHTGVVVESKAAAALKKSGAVSESFDPAQPRPMVLRDGLLQSYRHCQIEKELADRLSALAAAGRLSLITGGPGTGKTYTAARMLEAELKKNPGLRFALSAPTGKAAQRLAESTGFSAASTLHRLLEWRPGEDRCGRNEKNPLAFDLVIVDEASMLDLMLWRALLRALPEGASLLVLGDPMQLESIEPGRVLGSLIEAIKSAGALKGCHIELTKNFRFAEMKEISALAQAVRVSDATAAVLAAPPVAPDKAQVARFDSGDLDQAIERVWPRVRALAEAKDDETALDALEDLRILCALNEGRWGVSGLNAKIEKRLVAEGLSQDCRPVLVSVNDPQSGLFNGDLGVLMGGRAIFRGPSGVKTYPAAQLPEHHTAWAITVHRSQGSEYKSILLVLPPLDSDGEPHELLRRELLYTAVTRAQERVIIVADEAVLRAACRPGEIRVSGLEGWFR